jgi:tetratricopeptide (TPR) repeat protein
MVEHYHDDHLPSILDVDLNEIFIGRDQQLDLFDIYLERWKRLMAALPLRPETPTSFIPSPDRKIQGLVVLLYGCGGFGKSTLLRRYRDMALESDRNLAVSEIVDWEFDLGIHHGIFNPPQGRDLDAGDYFRIVCDQLAAKLGKRRDQFREYNDAATRVEAARKGIGKEIERLQQDDRYAWLRKATSKEAVALLRTFVPAANAVPGSDILAGIAEQGLDQGMKFSADQIKHLVEVLREKLGHQLDDCLEPALKVGVGLGLDLARFSKDYPLLICFDTYELIDEGDSLLRIVMGTAGARVGWVIAGRDNLWAGLEQRKRSLIRVYGYKEIVPSDRGLAVDFNVGGVGAFTGDDIHTYFTLLSERFSGQPLTITEEEAGFILDVTQGVPLAVKIAAALFLETSDLNLVIEKSDGQHEIVDQMVQRYLQHARDDQSERACLYGLALLRRADQPRAIAAALGLTPQQATTRYETELSRLHRRYSFIFTEKAQPSLHQEVRYFLRLWLLTNRRLPEVVAVNQELKKAHEAALKGFEERRHYSRLQERLQDDEWIGLYLDLVEQQWWLDPSEGVDYSLPFMLAAAIYRREANRDVVPIGNFFARDLGQPYGNWWKWAARSLAYSSSNDPSPEELTGLEELTKLTSHRCPTFPEPLPDCRQELKAALWWRVGEAYQDRDNQKALEWYEKALSRLGEQIELREAAAKIYWNVAYKLHEEKKHAERLPFLVRAIELKPDYVDAYNSRGVAYADLKEYQHAIEDYDRAIDLDPKYVSAYNNRGSAYLRLKDSGQARVDFSHSRELDPENINAGWMTEWCRMVQDGFGVQVAERLEQIAGISPQHYLGYICRGVALGLHTQLQEGLAEINQAIPMEPGEWDAYVWKGMICAYLGRNLIAKEAIEKSLELNLPPILLKPLYWLEYERPVFFSEYAGPLLTSNGISR